MCDWRMFQNQCRQCTYEALLVMKICLATRVNDKSSVVVDLFLLFNDPTGK